VLSLLDKELGAKIRGGLVVALGVASFLIAVLQAALDSLHFLPDVGFTDPVAVGSWLTAAIVYLGRFTALGNKITEG
jgi:hypothetical protein